MTNLHQLGENQRHLWQWSMLAILSLAIAGLFAVLLVLSRAPGTSEYVPWPEDFFQKGLITHVSLSFLVWFLAVFGALNTAMVPCNKSTSRIDLCHFMQKASILLFASGFIALLIPPFLKGGTPSLNNYIPVIINPIYYIGLVLLALGTLITVIRVLNKMDILATGDFREKPILIGASILYITAFVAAGMSAEQLKAEPISYDYNESLFWGSGHILQVFNVTLFFLGSSILYKSAFKTALATKFFVVWTTGLLVVIGLVGLSFYGIFEVAHPKHYPAFTNLQYVLGLPVTMILGSIALGIWRQRENLKWHEPASLSLISALIVFGIGAFMGLFVDGEDTRTPAHYHGIISGINLIFIGIFYAWFLPLLARAPKSEKLLSFQIILYAVGQIIFISGMFAAGGMGASRKIMGAGIDVDNISAILATGIRDFGGAISIAGGVLFIIIAFKSLFRQGNTVS